MGTPAFAVPSLARILDDGHEVLAVFSQPPRPTGRGMVEQASPVTRFARDKGLAVCTPPSLKDKSVQTALAALEADVAVVVAYGLILPPPVLAAPRLGCFNVHASLLPRWRGAAPIARAIMAGDEVTGVSIMRVTEGLDAGPVCLVERTDIAPGTTAGELSDRLALIGAELLSRALVELDTGRLDCRPQPEDGVTYAAKIDKAETHIDFTRPSTAVLNHIHGLSPRPGAWFALSVSGRESRIKALRAEPTDGAGEPGVTLDDALAVACGEGAVRLLLLQREGRSAVPSAAFLRGLAMPRGTRLS